MLYEKKNIKRTSNLSISLSDSENKKKEQLLNYFGLDDITGGQKYLWKHMLNNALEEPVRPDCLAKAILKDDENMTRNHITSFDAKPPEIRKVKMIQELLTRALEKQDDSINYKQILKTHALRYALHLTYDIICEKEAQKGEIKV